MKLLIEVDYTGVLRTRTTGVTGDDPVEGAQFYTSLKPMIERLDQIAKQFKTPSTK